MDNRPNAKDKITYVPDNITGEDIETKLFDRLEAHAGSPAVAKGAMLVTVKSINDKGVIGTRDYVMDAKADDDITIAEAEVKHTHVTKKATTTTASTSDAE